MNHRSSLLAAILGILVPMLAGGCTSPRVSAAAPLPAAVASPTPEESETKRRLEAKERRLHVDWAFLARYRDANAQVPPPLPNEPRVVFFGDSITDFWIRAVPGFFAGKPYLDRGISGQTTPQMLVRFRQDVVALQPKVVVILAGTNDLAGNTGASSLEMIEDNLQSMVEIARANGIRPVLASVLPAAEFGWNPGVEPGPKIAALNSWLKEYAGKQGVVYLDYYSAMVDERLGLPARLSEDGVHPNEAGYAVMAPLAERAIAAALKE